MRAHCCGVFALRGCSSGGGTLGPAGVDGALCVEALVLVPAPRMVPSPVMSKLVTSLVTILLTLSSSADTLVNSFDMLAGGGAPGVDSGSVDSQVWLPSAAGKRTKRLHLLEQKS